jgi:phosphatidylglycerol:prolipoprotein diacylglycerol transferase
LRRVIACPMISAPLVPYFDLPDVTLVPEGAFGRFPAETISIKPFGALVATGIYLGAYLAVRQGKRLGMDERALVSLIFWAVGTAFVGAHVLDLVFYYPDKLLADPLSLLRLWDGLSSFGGFCGAIAGALLWKLRYKQLVIPYIDVIGSAFPTSWVFGRLGCSIAHDHPGSRSQLWFAVQYPSGGRFDLGLYEMLLTIPLAVTFLVLRRKPRPWGFYTGVACVAYAPTRFALDFLRAKDVSSADPRYGGFTPAQWACFGLLLLGTWLFWRSVSSPSVQAVPGARSAVAPSGPNPQCTVRDASS